MMRLLLRNATNIAQTLAALFVVAFGSSSHAQSPEKEQAYNVYVAISSFTERLNSSSTEIEQWRVIVERVDAVLANETIREPILNEWQETSEAAKQDEKPEWLHGLDVVHTGETREVPGSEPPGDIATTATHSHLWIAGWDGLILHSKDDGLHWETQNSGTENHLQAVDFVDTAHGMIVGDNRTTGSEQSNDRKKQTRQRDAGSDGKRQPNDRDTPCFVPDLPCPLCRMGPDLRNPSGPAVRRTAQTGRTQDRF